MAKSANPVDAGLALLGLALLKQTEPGATASLRRGHGPRTPVVADGFGRRLPRCALQTVPFGAVMGRRMTRTHPATDVEDRSDAADEAETWLVENLTEADDWMLPVSAIVADAERDGISGRTLQQAKRRMAVKAERRKSGSVAARF